jgi:hypothetical protein
MRIAGARLDASVAHLLSEILRDGGFPSTADKVADAIKRQITTEAPLTLDDHEAILAVLSPQCPATLYRLRERLLEEQRYVRRATNG